MRNPIPSNKASKYLRATYQVAVSRGGAKWISFIHSKSSAKGPRNKRFTFWGHDYKWLPKLENQKVKRSIRFGQLRCPSRAHVRFGPPGRFWRTEARLICTTAGTMPLELREFPAENGRQRGTVGDVRPSGTSICLSPLEEKMFPVKSVTFKTNRDKQTYSFHQTEGKRPAQKLTTFVVFPLGPSFSWG